jgi:hypothetical protein
MFVYTREGHINLRHVARVETAWLAGGAIRHLFYNVTGDLIGKSDDQDFDIEKLTAPVVPAARGTSVVLIYRPHREASRPEEGDVWAEYVPVLGWRLTQSGAQPVIHDEVDLESARVLHPFNGRFLCPGDQTFETVARAVADTLRDAQEVWDAHHAKRTAGAAQ